MKKILFIIAFAGVALQGTAQKNTVAPVEEDPMMVHIEEHTKEMASNTRPILVWRGKSYDSWVLLFVSLMSLVVGIVSTTYSIRTTRHTKRTAMNVREQTLQQAIDRSAQRAILTDLIRHLYLNKVKACAIRWKLSDLGFDKCYPSEELLLKMKVLPEDLRLDKFDSSPGHYGQLHRLMSLFRNYTIEVDVALEHLKSKSVAESVKVGDLLGLESRSQQITEKIRDLMECTGLTISDDDIRNMLLEMKEERHGADRGSHDPKHVPERAGEAYRFYDRLGLTEQLDREIARKYNRIDTIEFPIRDAV